jgi:transcriptional regulator with GAF, ATPase, and Fis domain
VARIVGDGLARKHAELALRRALDFERLLATLFATFVHLPVDFMDRQIVEAIGRVANFVGADRANIIKHLPAERALVRTHQWAREGVAAVPAPVPVEAVPWLMTRVFKARELLAVNGLDELLPEAARDRATLEQLGVVSGAIAPLMAEDRVMGVLSFETPRHKKPWTPELVGRLRLVAEVVAGALARRDAELALRTSLAENTRLRARIEAKNAHLQEGIHEAHDFGEIVGESGSLRSTLRKVDQVAVSDAPVLLVGETGTGKELLARAVHARSHRSRASFIAVNCAALPASLIESELFGHEKGAFTGATHSKAGRFELADGGTLFLDEIGDLDPVLQTKLLRVLQDGEFQRLGSTVTRKANVRIISATNRDLKRALAEGRFRADLYYRLAVFPIEVAPLRERREDIPLLVWHFILSRQRTLGRQIDKVPTVAMDALMTYDWPGNIRELQNVIERSLILSKGPVLRIEEAFESTPSEDRERCSDSTFDNLQQAERVHIVRILESCGWAIEGRGQAAERLGLRPSTLRNRMKKLGIRRPAH